MIQLYCRAFQYIMRAVSYLLPWRMPILLQGKHPYQEMIKELSPCRNILIITDANLMRLGLLDALLDALRQADVSFAIYDKTPANPTIASVEAALALFRQKQCGAVIAFGGGSPIDCAKAVCARAVKPNKSVAKMKGLFRVLKRIVPLVAIPTTAGTGSETTVAAIICNAKTREKYAITDLSLVPRYALLDPHLTLALPPQLTAATGMDALTHAVEAFIGGSNTKQTRADAIEAVQLIHQSLYAAYCDGGNLTARAQMLQASHHAGKAFTRAYVGNVHAIAHALGGFYHLPHGLANAVVLPVVLREYGAAVHADLATLADCIALTPPSQTDAQKAEVFITWIEALLVQMALPRTLPQIVASDIPTLAKRSCKEANPLYPVPVIWDKAQFETVYRTLKGDEKEEIA